ncbi:MAG: leucine-rich repeat domain-containing protein [Acutalibacteraceae bacterium]|nr:leucine-rich repeat domain-containing protein [Acutalibacteraceae bacterium]
MKQEHKHCLKRVAAAALVMLMVSGTVPFQPIAEVFDTAITASAAEITSRGEFDNGVSWTLDSDGKLTITGTGNIPEDAFKRNSEIKSVIIASGITGIANRAFMQCSNLTSVTISDTVTSIGNYAFYYCSSLTSVTISDGVESIGNYAFYRCSLTSVTIPDSVTIIGNGAFDNCSSLTSVTIPDSVESIGDNAFYNCSSLTSVTIPDSVESIGDWAFSYCYSLTSVTIPKNVTSIGGDTFYFSDSSSITDVYCYADPAKLNWNDMGSDDFIKNPQKTTVCHVLPQYLSTYQSDKFSSVNVTFVGNLGFDKIDAKDATCTTAGNIEYYKDSQDGKYYNKTSDTTYEEITKDQTVVAAAGHDWGEVSYTWSDDNLKVTATRTCDRDSSHVDTETVNTTAVTKDPTCVDKGETTYTATFTNTAFETQTKTIETDNATGIHTYSERSPEWSWVKNGNTFDVSVKFKCAVCDEYETTDIKPTLNVTESNGIRNFTATVTHDDVTYTSERDEAVSYNIAINDTTKQYKYGEYVTATAPAATNGQYFDGWYEGKTKVSSSEVYTIYATRDMSIHAEYKDSVVEAQPVYVMNVSDRTALANGKQKVSFTYDWDLPEGYTLVKAAIVRSYVVDEPKITTANTNVHYTTLKNARGTYKLNLTLGTANANKSVYVRGYIVYKDKTGTQHEDYTTVLTSVPASN